MDASNVEDLDNGVAPPSYDDVVLDNMASGTLPALDHSHSNRPPPPGPLSHRDAPPPYLNLFGMTSSVLQPPRVTFVPGPEESQGSVPNQQSQPSTTATTTRNNNNNNNTGCGSLYYEAATKNKPCTALYYALFWIGLLLALAMIASGCWRYEETKPEDAIDVTGGNIWFGCLLLFFILWHTLTLLFGVFTKRAGKMGGLYWFLRLCHCGCCCWAYQFIPYSIFIWLGVTLGNIFPPSLFWFIISCMIIQYLIVLYCLFELAYDYHGNWSPDGGF